MRSSMQHLPRAIHDTSRDEDTLSQKKPMSSRHNFNAESPSLVNQSQSQIYSTMNERDVEMDNLKTIIIALNQKVKAKDDLENQLELLQKNLNQSEEAREELRQQIEMSAQTLQQNQVKNEKFQNLIIEENKNWNLVDQEKETIIGRKDSHIQELQQQMNQYERKMNEMQLEAEDLNALAQESNSLRDQLIEAAEVRKNL